MESKPFQPLTPAAVHLKHAPLPPRTLLRPKVYLLRLRDRGPKAGAFGGVRQGGAGRVGTLAVRPRVGRLAQSANHLFRGWNAFPGNPSRDCPTGRTNSC